MAKGNSTQTHAPDLITRSAKTKTGRVIHVLDNSLRYKRAVIAQLQTLLEQAVDGEIIGMVYTVTHADRTIKAGACGILAKDRLKAAGLLFGAAMSAAEDLEE